MNPFHTFPTAENDDDDDDYDDEDERSNRHLGRWGALVVAVLAGVVLLGPHLVSGVSDWLHHDNAAAVITPTPLQPASTAAASTVADTATGTPSRTATGTATASTPRPTASPVPTLSTTAPAISSPESPAMTPVTAAPPPATAATTPATTPAGASPAVVPEVTMLQTVPPIRDLVVRINGKTLTSDGLGSIALSEPDRHGQIEVVGMVATPALQQVDFSGWSDGSKAAVRSLDTMSGPVAQIGLVVRNRVVASTAPKSATGAQVAFNSAAGVLQLVLDQPTWVPTARAVPVGGGLATQSLTYTAETLTTPSAAAPVPVQSQSFVAAPESLWLISV